MIGVSVCIIAVLLLLWLCASITTENFDKTLMKQAEEWEK